MAELLKDRYNKDFCNTFTSVVSKVIDSFKTEKFLKKYFHIRLDRDGVKAKNVAYSRVFA